MYGAAESVVIAAPFYSLGAPGYRTNHAAMGRKQPNGNQEFTRIADPTPKVAASLAIQNQGG
jgi:hypothetical protein